MRSTLCQLITSLACSGEEQPLEKVAHSQVFQVASMALHFQWCRECEEALLQSCYDRQALTGARNKFNSGVLKKLVALLIHNSWKAVDEVLPPLKRASLEGLVTVTSEYACFDVFFFLMLPCFKVFYMAEGYSGRFVSP